MKRVMRAGIFQVFIALLLVAAILGAGGWISARNAIFLQIFLGLISAGGTIIAAIITVRYQAEKKKRSNPKSGPVKGYNKAKNDLIKYYQDSLCHDPRVAHLKILDMNRPLEIKNIYIQVRVHQETGLSFELDATLVDAATGNRGDNVQLLKADRLRIERRANVAIDPVKVIGDKKHCVIVGDPGTGKTTLLKYLALKAIKAIEEPYPYQPKLPDFPIYIELSAFVSSGSSDLLEFAASLWQQRYNIEYPKNDIIHHMKDRLAEGEALLLLDALDEAVIGGTKEEPTFRRRVDGKKDFQ